MICDKRSWSLPCAVHIRWLPACGSYSWSRSMAGASSRASSVILQLPHRVRREDFCFPQREPRQARPALAWAAIVLLPPLNAAGDDPYQAATWMSRYTPILVTLAYDCSVFRRVTLRNARNGNAYMLYPGHFGTAHEGMYPLMKTGS